MRKVEVIEKLEITGISSTGKAVGRKDDLVIFVNQGAPGDVIDVKIVGNEKKFLIGSPVFFHEKSPDRTAPFCEHFGVCGGCKWQHLNYPAQLKFKAKHVRENLKKISKMELPEAEPIMGSAETDHYRNKLEYTFSNKRWLTQEEIQTDGSINKNALGFHIPRMFDKILDINQCHLQPNPSNEIRLALKNFADTEGFTFYDIKKQQGLLRNLIIRTTTTEETMVIVQFGEADEEKIKKVMQFLAEQFPQLTSLLYLVNLKKNETIYDQNILTYAGNDFIIEKMGDLRFKIGPKSFFQTNPKQAYELYKKINVFADLKGNELVFDLYSGTGTIANFLAKNSRKVIGIESVPEAVEDAHFNSKLNQIDNTEFYAGDMKDMLSGSFIKVHGRPDLVITDPPRMGMHQNVIEALNQLNPDRIIYVSCNPATQARDMELMKDHYEVIKTQPVDMFPHTQHIENIVLLKSK